MRELKMAELSAEQLFEAMHVCIGDDDMERFESMTEELRRRLALLDNWEQKIENKHSVYTWCRSCGMRGINVPECRECGNCSSMNTVKYYDSDSITEFLNKVTK